MSIPCEEKIVTDDQGNASIDFSAELALEERCRTALYESVHILKYKGITGEAMLVELLKVNLQLPRPVAIDELPIIADYPPDDDNLDAYDAILDMLHEAEIRLTEGPGEEPAGPSMADVDQAIAAKDVKALYVTMPALIELRASSAVAWSLKKTEIKEAFGKEINMNDLERAVATEQRKMEQALREDEPDIADIARDWAYINRDSWAYDAKNKVWRRYNGSYWEELEPKSPQLGNEAVDALHAAGREVNTLNSVNCFLQCAADARATIFAEGQARKINFANGTLDVETMQLSAYRREDYLTYCLPYDYAPGPHTRIDAFLEQTIPDPYARIVFMAHLGLALMGDTKLHNVVILLGTTRSGKTTLLALGNMVCGALLYEAFDFADHHIFSRELEGKRSRYAWKNRRLVGVDEVPAEALRDEELFKQMSAHSGVGMRGMHKDDKANNNRWRPKLLLAANDRPRYKDVVGAVRERCIFIECPNHRPKGNRDLSMIDTLEPEVGAFAATCLFLAQAVLERGYYPLSNQMKLVLDEIDKEGSYLKSFLASECIIEPESGDRVTTDTLYQQYISYCHNNGVRDQYHLTKEVFSRQIVNMRLGVTRSRFFSEEGKLARGLVNIRLRMGQDHWRSEEEELDRYQSDEPLFVGTLTPIDGKLTLQEIRVNTIHPPVEPVEPGSLTPLTDKTENFSLTDTPLVKADPKVGGSLEKEKNAPDVSIASSVGESEPVEPVQTIDTSLVEPSGDLSDASREPSEPVCEVKGCGQPAEPSSEEEAACYGHWCSTHEDRMEMMVFGEMLSEPYARLEYSIGSAVAKGAENWRRFATYASAPVQRVLTAINAALDQESPDQENETA